MRRTFCSLVLQRDKILHNRQPTQRHFYCAFPSSGPLPIGFTDANNANKKKLANAVNKIVANPDEDQQQTLADNSDEDDK